MGGIIDKIIRFYQMRSEALGIVVGNTGKALREKKDNEETEKLQNFAENLTRDVNDTLTRFYFRKERKEKRYQRLSDEEVNALADFANFARNLAASVPSWLSHLRKNGTFEGKLDEETKQIETYVKKRIKEFDEVLEDALTGRGRMFIKRLVKRLDNVVRGIAKPSRGERLVMKSRDEMEGVCQRRSPAKLVILESPEVQRRDSRQLLGNHLRIQKRN
ncbi:MAG: hypothetical protein MUO27_05345 [Sedimentisphaerales bacterium]|nr:hypothetical protein [Sedimentisphaerales bacterium]